MKLTTKLTIVLVALAFFAACENGDKVDKSVADTNLLLALAQANSASNLQSQIDAQIEIRGAWAQSSCSSGNCGTTVSAKVYIDSDLGASTGFFYQENPPTCWTGGGCTTANGSQFADFYPANYSIVEYSNTDKVLYYRNRSSNKYSSIVWITQGTDVLACDLFSGKDSLAEAKTDLASKKAAGTVSTSNPKSGGCNGPTFAFNIYRKQS